MKRYVLEFFRKGIAASCLGPLVLAVLYLVLHGRGTLQTLTVEQVCTGIFSLSALAFVAGGLNCVYQIERLPLMMAVLIHGGVLYIAYLLTYLINGWLEWGTAPILVFTGIFVVGYFAIWVGISFAMRRNTKRINAVLEQKRRTEQDM